MVKFYTPQIEPRENGKFHYTLRYINPYTQKTQKKTRDIEKNTAFIRQRTYQILVQEINEELDQYDATTYTLKDLSVVYLKWLEKNRPYQSYYVYRSAINLTFKEIDSNMIVDKVKLPFWTKYFNSLLLEKSYSTVNVRRSAISSMLSFGVEYGYISTNPLQNFKLNKIKKTGVSSIEEKYFTTEEYNALIECAKKNEPDYSDVFEFMYYTGLRIGECSALTAKDFFQSTTDHKWYLKVQGTMIKKHVEKAKYKADREKTPHEKQSHTKNAAGMRIEYLPPAAVKIYKKHVSPDHQFIFTKNSTGNPMEPGSVSKALKRIAKKAGIKKNVTTHFFRHTHVSVLATKGIPLEDIKKRVGHSSSNVTEEIYYHITDESSQRLENTLDKL